MNEKEERVKVATPKDLKGLKRKKFNGFLR